MSPQGQQTFGHGAHQRGRCRVGAFLLGAHIGHADQREGDDRGEKGRCVEQNRRAGAQGGDQQPTRSVANQARQVKDSAIEGDGIGQLGRLDQLDKESATRRMVNSQNCTKTKIEDDDMPENKLTADDQKAKDCRLHQQRTLGKEDQFAARHAVDQHATEQRNGQDRQQPQQTSHAQPEGGAGQIVDQPPFGDHLERGTNQ